MNNIYYFDNAATQFTSAQVRQAMVDAPQGNSNSFHDIGLEARRFVKNVEEKILRLINAPNGKIIWTSGGSEANGLISYFVKCCSTIEHKSLIKWIKCQDWKVDKDGYINYYSGADLNKSSIQLVNNELGCLQNISKINKDYNNIVFHSDCVQALGKYNIDVQKLGVHSISLSAHKIGGPKGIGCLWVSDGLGDNFKNEFTLNISGIAGFSAAIDEIDVDFYQEKMEKLNEIFFCAISSSYLFPSLVYFNNLLSITRGSSIFSLQIPGVSGAELAMHLNNKKVYVSTGSACNSGEEKPSHVLKAIGLTDEQALSTIRISLSSKNTIEEIQKGAKIILETIKELINE